MATGIRILCMVLLTGIGAARAERPANLPGNYPSRPVRVVIGSSPGGGTDIIARMIITRLADHWGHAFVAENMASGIGGVIAIDAVAKAAGDGYTLLVSSNSAVVNAAVVSRTNAGYDVRTALIPVAQFTSQPYVLGVSNALPATGVRELLDYIRARPGTVNYASGGIGTAAHIGMEDLRRSAGLDMVHIPYKGIGPAIVDMMAGRVQLLFGGVLSVMPPARSGKIKALAVTSAKRSALLPDLPALAESGVSGFEMTGWYGFLGPTGMPSPIVGALNEGVHAVLRQPDILRRLSDEGADVPLTSPARFRELMLAEIDKVARLVREAGLKLE